MKPLVLSAKTVLAHRCSLQVFGASWVNPQHPPDPAPHELWELDAKGPGMVDGVGMVSTINSIDVGGRVKVESTPTACAAPNREDYQIALRRGFLT
jgi:hypothetical protein